MTVKELIIKLLDEKLDSEVAIEDVREEGGWLSVSSELSYSEDDNFTIIESL